MEKRTPIEAASVGLVACGRILLVCRRHDPAKGLYAFPGGRIEAGETPEQAVRRELKEETGLFIERLEPLEIIDFDGGDGNPVYRLHVFCGVHEGTLPIAGDDATHAGWFRQDEIETLPITQTSLVLAKRLLSKYKIKRS